MSTLHPYFHSSLLNRYKDPPIPADEPELDPVAGREAKFKVEAIINTRIARGRHKYLVKWKHFDQASKSWEPMSNLKNCQDLVKDFDDQK